MGPDNKEYVDKRDNLLTLFELKGLDTEAIAACKEAMDMAYEMGFEEGYCSGCDTGANQ